MWAQATPAPERKGAVIGIKELTRIEIDSDKVLKAIGYKNRSRVPARTLSLVDDYVENAQHLLDPSYAYVIRDVQRVQGRWTYIEGDIVFESEVIVRLLEKCSRVAIFVLTIGSNLEKIAAGLAQDGLVVKASMLEAVGSVAAEGLAEFVQARISHVAGTYGLADSRRFSPGYYDWSVRQQRALFKALEANSLRDGVRVLIGGEAIFTEGIGPYLPGIFVGDGGAAIKALEEFEKAA